MIGVLINMSFSPKITFFEFEENNTPVWSHSSALCFEKDLKIEGLQKQLMVLIFWGGKQITPSSVEPPPALRTPSPLIGSGGA